VVSFEFSHELAACEALWKWYNLWRPLIVVAWGYIVFSAAVVVYNRLVRPV